MGQLSAPSPASHRNPKPWPRSNRRRWVRANDDASLIQLLALIPSLPRPLLARLTTSLIDRMDEIDGDSDVEPTGDELDGSMGEDDFHRPSSKGRGPGCSIADPDHCPAQEDAGTDPLLQPVITMIPRATVQEQKHA